MGMKAKAFVNVIGRRPTIRRSLAELAVPWASIVLAAVAVVVYNGLCETKDSDLFGERLLAEQHELQPVFQTTGASLFPLTSSDVWGFALATLGLVLAAGGGIGGGGILVPIFCLLMGFSPKQAIPLANVTVFGGSVANCWFNARKRHPLADRPLVDWDLILVMEPLTIGGALIGALLNKLLPELVLTAFLVLLLSFTAYTSLCQATKLYEKESLAINARESEQASLIAEKVCQDNKEAVGQQRYAVSHIKENEDEEEGQGENGERKIAKEAWSKLAKVGSLEPDMQDERERLLQEARETPQTNINILLVMFVVVLTSNLLKGGGAFRSSIGIKCGSFMFWLANLIMLLWVVAVAVFVRQLLLRKYHRKQRCRFPYVEGDIQWDKQATIVYPCVCCLAGFFAGMFGVGGGIVKGPLLLHMGVHPAVASVSSACMILFTSFTATTCFIVYGLLVFDYAIVCWVAGFTATAAGQLGLAYVIKKAGRNSYIAFSIGAVVLLSAFLMTFQSLLRFAEGEQHTSSGVCGAGF